MPRIPKKLSRQTNHNPPRYQIYQPGFNRNNSCWLDGKWITISKEDFITKAAEQQKLYSGILKEQQSQYYRNKATTIKGMTSAQRQAWEFYSGTICYDVIYSNGHVGAVRLDAAKDKPLESSLKWLRERGGEIIPKVQEGNKVRNQTRGVPKDLLAANSEPLNVTKNVVQQNRKAFREQSEAIAESIALGDSSGPMFAMMAIQNILELEQSIVRQELEVEDDLYETVEELLHEYKKHRKVMEAKMGKSFKTNYLAAKQSHNQCARINLDNSSGRLYSFVLPNFRTDGTHEPIGAKDFPWGHPKEFTWPNDQ